MMTTKATNYTAEQTTELVNAYRAGETVEALAERLNKSVRSVVAKLSREGAYVAKARVAGGRQATKAQMLTMVESLLRLEAGTLESFQKGDKAAIEALLDAITVPAN